jgi:hypothetical protein
VRHHGRRYIRSLLRWRLLCKSVRLASCKLAICCIKLITFKSNFFFNFSYSFFIFRTNGCYRLFFFLSFFVESHKQRMLDRFGFWP